MDLVLSRKAVPGKCRAEPRTQKLECLGQVGKNFRTCRFKAQGITGESLREISKFQRIKWCTF